MPGPGCRGGAGDEPPAPVRELLGAGTGTAALAGAIGAITAVFGRGAAGLGGAAAITCVPGCFFGAEAAPGGGGGTEAGGKGLCEGLCEEGGPSSDGGAPCEMASRWDSTLLTASGETCEGAGGAGGGGGTGGRACASVTSGGGPYIESRRAFPGSAVSAKGFTVAGRGLSTGVPHAEQNLREPMSSAPHFAQWVM
jgi:hypothetical protein